MIDIIQTKILTALGVFTVSCVSCSAPMKLLSVDEFFFSAGNLLASGVLLAAGLVHQLPDSARLLSTQAMNGTSSTGSGDGFDSTNDSSFPFAYFIAGLTFCTFLILEEFLHTKFDGVDFYDSSQRQYPSSSSPSLGNRAEESTTSNHAGRTHHRLDDHDSHNHQHQHDKGHPLCQNQTTSNSIHHHHHRHHDYDDDDDYTAIEEANQDENTALVSSNPLHLHQTSHQIVKEGRQSSPSFPCCRHSSFIFHEGVNKPHHHHHHDKEESTTNTTPKHPTTFESSLCKKFASQHHHHHHHDHVAEHMHGSLLASIILLVALSVHSIVEGLAIGASDNITMVTSTTVAVVAHKGFAGYALGSSMVASQMKEGHFMMLCWIFASCSIIGIFLGMVTVYFFEDTEIGNSSTNVTPATTATGIIQAMVAGTFLYVSIVEMGLKEILLCRDSKVMGDRVCERDMAWGKLGAFLIGYLSMSALAIFV